MRWLARNRRSVEAAASTKAGHAKGQPPAPSDAVQTGSAEAPTQTKPGLVTSARSDAPTGPVAPAAPAAPAQPDLADAQADEALIKAAMAQAAVPTKPGPTATAAPSAPTKPGPTATAAPSARPNPARPQRRHLLLRPNPAHRNGGTAPDRTRARSNSRSRRSNRTGASKFIGCRPERAESIKRPSRAPKEAKPRKD